MNDLKFAFRQLLKNPGFTAVAVLTLTLGIRASSTVFGLVRGVLPTPAPSPQPRRLGWVTRTHTDGQSYTRTLSVRRIRMVRQPGVNVLEWNR